MRVALVRNGVVETIAAVEAEHFDSISVAWAAMGLAPVVSDTALIGDTYDGATFTTPPPPLADVKAAKLADIAAKSDALRAAGFAFTGKAPDGSTFTGRFNLDHDALRQVSEALYWADRDVQMGTSNFSYPLVWPTQDRTGAVVLASHADVVAFALAASLADRALTASGAMLQAQVTAATTVDQVNAIVDPR